MIKMCESVFIRKAELKLRRSVGEDSNDGDSDQVTLKSKYLKGNPFEMLTVFDSPV